MSEPEFDPYHKWLGVPTDQRPPTNYQLLAISPDEQDGEVIEEAGMMRSAHLRSFQTGPHADECTRLLTEIAAAVDTLRDPHKRTAYDSTLPKSPPKAAATDDKQLAKLDKQKQRVESLLKQSEFDQARELLDKMSFLENPRLREARVVGDEVAATIGNRFGFRIGGRH